MVDQAFVDYHARLFFRIEMVLFDSRLHIVLQIFIKAELFVFCEPFDWYDVRWGARVREPLIIIRLFNLQELFAFLD